MKKIAVIEDNEDNRFLLEAILEDLYIIQEYEDGFKALEGLQKDIPDLVFLDISLPRMDGIEVLQNIRLNEKLKSLPVIACTAHAMAGDKEKFMSAGFDDYITKPISESILLDTISKFLHTE